MNRQRIVQWARRALLLAAILSLLGALLPGATRAAAYNGVVWTAEYYNNPTLTGSPAYTAQVAPIGFDWTAGAPAPGINADFFSIRYTSVQTLAAGAYTIQVKADDGVRVYLNGQLVINQFGTSTGLTYSYPFAVAQGQHVIVVEYYEGAGVAFFDYQLLTTAPPPITGAQGTVVTGALNVRSAPSVFTGAIVTRVRYGDVIPIVGRNANGTWWQITANGVPGWVNGSYVSAVNTQNVPITDGTTPPPATSFTATAYVNLNIRSGPSINNPVIGWLPAYQAARIIGRNSASTWWSVTYGRYTGWVNAAYTSVYPATGTNTIPIIDGGPVPPPTSYTATTVGNLNMRSGPAVTYPLLNWLPVGNTVPVIGRNSALTWFQVQYGGYTGWVSGLYLSFPAGTNTGQIPVTG